jgi:hypothetical protein
LRHALVSLLLVLAVAGCGAAGELTESGLRKQAEAVQSTAAEGALLAGDVARDRTTEPFARIHSGELVGQAKSAGTSLRAVEAPTALQADRKRAVAVAADVQRALDRLHEAPTDQLLARRIERQLERDAQRAAELAG